MPCSTPGPQPALMTCSYRPDLARCARLCRSVDRHVSESIPHLLIVPGRDLAHFRHLAGGRRSLLAVEDVVPGHFRQLPGLRKWWLDDGAWPVRGWVMQQVTKLSANFATTAPTIVFADSDLQFLRALDPRHLFRGGRLRLHRIPGARPDGEHRRWHDRAARLLGLPSQYFGADYVGQLVSWHRSHLEGLQQHIEQVQGQGWQRAVARSLRVSEYILYGAYIEAVVGLQNSAHYGHPRDLCH